MNELGVSLLKYFHTMSTGGPKIQGSREFLRSIHDIGNKEIADGREWWGDRQHASQWGEVAGAITKYLRPGRQKFNVVSVADESMKGFSALEITRKLLIKEAANFAPGTETRNAYEELITILPEKKETYNPGKGAPGPGKVYSKSDQQLKAMQQANPLARLFAGIKTKS